MSTAIWQHSLHLAESTPNSRNRYVDFLRAASIMVVVIGHWLMAAPVITDQGLTEGHLLSLAPWTHYLTWVLQVMPIFFFVGGYANAASWRAARREHTPYGAWLRARLRRLTLPVLPLLMVWAAGAAVLLRSGLDPDLLRIGSQVALVPVWFLATYVAVVAFTPLTLTAWERWSWGSLGVGAGAAGLVDLIVIGAGVGAVGYLNYLLVWGTVHSFGYAWADSRLGAVRRRLVVALGGLAATALLVGLGPYPVAMVGFTTEGITNTFPPKVTLITIALLQAGLLLALEGPTRRLLDRTRVWAATILVNGRIMTLYLWHLTAMVAVIGGSLLLGGLGLRVAADTPVWWLTRPLWMLGLTVATLPFLVVFGRYERPRPDHRPPPPAWRPLLAVLATCAGLGLLALNGVADEEGLNGVALSLPFAAAIAGGVGGARWWQRRNP
ncbi:MAG: acyltransferase family protein [Actinomycetota bacterium]